MKLPTQITRTFLLHIQSEQNPASSNADEEVEENKISSVALGLQNDTFNTVYFLTELKHLFTVLLNNWPPWFLPIRCGCLYSHKNLHKGIYKCFIYNYKNSESIKFSFRRWRDKCSVIYPVNTEPLDAKRKWTIKLWKGLEETYRHISRWNKQIWKPLLLGKHMAYNMLLILYKRQIYRDRKVCDHLGFGMKRVKKKERERDRAEIFRSMSLLHNGPLS